MKLKTSLFHLAGLPHPPPLPGHQQLMAPALMPQGKVKGEGMRDTLPAAFEKKLRRLEKNRESARGASLSSSG